MPVGGSERQRASWNKMDRRTRRFFRPGPDGVSTEPALRTGLAPGVLRPESLVDVVVAGEDDLGAKWLLPRPPGDPAAVGRAMGGGLRSPPSDQTACPRDPHGDAGHRGSASTEVTRALAGIATPCLSDIPHPVEPIDPGAVRRIEQPTQSVVQSAIP